MIKEAYVSFEVAKLLKEKGFDISCHQKYDDEGYLSFNDVGYINSEKPCDDFYALAPTQQMAMAWLREEHNKYCDIGYDIDLNWFFQIIELKELKEHFDYSELKYYYAENSINFNTYEEAVEAALKYVLENLI